jgi:hypothetical protein
MTSFQAQVRELEAIGDAVDHRLTGLQVESETCEQQYAQELAARAARVRNLTATPEDLRLDTLEIGTRLAESRNRVLVVAEAAVELSSIRIALLEREPTLAQQEIASALIQARTIAQQKAGIPDAELSELARQSAATSMWKQLARAFFDLCESATSIARYYLDNRAVSAKQELEDLNKLTAAIKLATSDLTEGLRVTRELAEVLSAKYPASHELNIIAAKNLSLLTDHATIKAAQSAPLN